MKILYAVIKMLYFVPAKFQSFADRPRIISISKVDKFNTGLSMIIQKNRRVRISSQNLIRFAIRCHREKHLSTSIRYRRFLQKIIKKNLLAGILLHIIKLKTVYSYKSHHYGGCNQSRLHYLFLEKSSQQIRTTKCP